jgi:hypothetical protein
MDEVGNFKLKGDYGDRLIEQSTGGAQNIKLKQKDKDKENQSGDGTKKTSGLRGLRNLV